MRDALDWIQPSAAMGDEDLLEFGPRRPRPTWLRHVSGRRARLPKLGWLAAAPLSLVALLTFGPAGSRTPAAQPPAEDPCQPLVAELDVNSGAALSAVNGGQLIVLHDGTRLVVQPGSCVGPVRFYPLGSR